MKVIIDIPEDLKKMIFDNKMFDIAHSYRLAMCVKNGTPLDDVMAEIEEKISHYDHFSSSNTAHGLSMALAIIDKHIGKAESEET